MKLLAILLFCLQLTAQSPDKWVWSCREGSEVSSDRDLVRLKPKEISKRIVSCAVPKLPGAFDGQGTFLLELEIDEAGNVRCERILTGSDHPIMQRAVLDAVKQWKFAPLPVGGKPKPYLAILTLTVSWDPEESGKQCPKEKRRARVDLRRRVNPDVRQLSQIKR